MRMLATISGQAKAEALVAYLLTLQISTHVEPSKPKGEPSKPEGEPGKPEGEWEVWIREEDRLNDARSELSAFLVNPDDPKYADAISKAQQIISEKKQQRVQATRNVKTGRTLFRGGPMGAGGGIPPVTLTLLVLASLVSLLTNFMRPGEHNLLGKTILEEMEFVSHDDYFKKGKCDPAASLKKGELWRVITPMFPHGNTFHLLFNILAMIQLGRIVERMEGTFRYVLLVILTGVFSSLLQGLLPERFFGFPFFGGLSGVVYGVFGFLLVKTYLRPEMGIRLSQTSVMIMLGWLALGFTNQMGPIANMAHLGGLLGGAFIAFLDVQQSIASGKK